LLLEEQLFTMSPSRREWIASAGLGLGAIALAACGGGSTGANANATLYRMGQRAEAGPLVYNVLETEWLSAIGTRLPKNKFLSVRLTILNSGNTERSVPLLSLVDNKGKEVLESSEGEGLEEWLGILRNLAATETVQGRLLFDVPQDNYKLIVTDGGEPGSEKTALVDMPLRLEEKNQVVTPAGAAPQQ
jgi:hypothetical protein